ncbi:hypothetical protein A3G55_02205 [Candidatus Giovannonibacteria bacterium RIFCSPLOWO2_12_FULL_44_25]|uniref:Uncharacterized protein n=4 Tax=Parcubacteria group TaxID=1794811 RepID=A0A837ILT2_9BACT|nr:MAG: hypothetical protein UW15_C0001G0044 [Parcubacteria group bacterium GW2011_GWC1_44_10]KKT57564.1 MAG: hypothetical protein UW49_C0003G0043 [Candidatus Giovannonibacteria bacterium GW2011_GWB1_44_23]KKT59825.1 MAG: hypothetical protein UW53_C0007G0043 [Candidatus Giovannonibacteria bacterium GW2011_GWA1_44_25]KKU13091.1 MAG: hypothetical protein UX18_C0002G0012 [Candidatus Azambacteria bacterium GW2011_GWC2_45_7b]OGF49556.1 MAG: hypothetical protein A2120_01105 [Candidatus Giovannonibact
MKKGVTLLLAVFISTIAISLGLGIFAIIFGELKISGSAKESLIALYAADSGVECALYWDLAEGAFSITSPPASVNCVGDDHPVVFDAPFSRFTFDVQLTESDSCAHVRVEKPSEVTTVTALGENTGCGSASARTVQRGFEVKY